MTNFGFGWGTVLSFPPQMVYAQTVDFVPGGGETLPSVIPGLDTLPVSLFLPLAPFGLRLAPCVNIISILDLLVSANF